MLDDSPHLLEQSYRLRYQVYCLERKFLPASDYPDQREIDEFDCHSVHVGVVDADGELAATARLIKSSPAGWPLFQHCTVFPEHEALIKDAANTVVEVSRVSISRRYTGRRHDGFFGISDILTLDHVANPTGPERRLGRSNAFATLANATYQAAKRLGATHWIAATEKSLQRLVVQFGLPFRPAGPETNYYGVVTPYVMSMAEFDHVILSGQIAGIDNFLVGLEPEFTPRETKLSP